MKSVTGRPSPRGQTLAKATFIAQQSVLDGLDAAAVGETEWAVLGREALLELVEQGYPALAANLVCEGGSRPLPAAKRIEKGGRSIGVIGITTGEIPGCQRTDPVTAINDARALFQEPVDAVVLLWAARDEAAHSAALKGLAVDFVVDASGRIADGGRIPQAGSSWLIGGGGQTKQITHVALQSGADRTFFPEGYASSFSSRSIDLQRRMVKMEAAVAEQASVLARQQLARLKKKVADLERDQRAIAAGTAGSFTLTNTTLDDKIADDAEVQARVEELKASYSSLIDASPLQILGRKQVGPEGSRFAGAAACADCHPAEMKQWRSTLHSRAYTALVRDQHHLDADCYSCHVTGAGRAFDEAKEVGGLLHVQCEACHGPARDHVADPSVLPVRAPDVSVCTTCHDGERDEGRFDYPTYRARIVHQAD